MTSAFTDLIQQSAINALWIPFAEEKAYAETNLRWIACQFIARLEVTFPDRPTWLDIDFLVRRFRAYQSLVEDYDGRHSVFDSTGPYSNLVGV